MKNRIGIFGGSFDPVHNGHLIIAESIRVEFKLDKVIFVPAFRSPHKQQSKYTTPEQRMKMIEMSIRDNKFFESSDFEIVKKDKSYTVESLEYFKNKYIDSELFLIIGGDSCRSFNTWKEPEKIRDLGKIIVAARYNQEINENIEVANSPIVEISSTDIREKLKKKISIKYLVNSEVEHYINYNKLYS